MKCHLSNHGIFRGKLLGFRDGETVLHLGNRTIISLTSFWVFSSTGLEIAASLDEESFPTDGMTNKRSLEFPMYKMYSSDK